jgi:hypothetical protein
MYIKVKHIKHFILIVACLFFGGFNYFTYVSADDTRANDKAAYVCDKALDADCDGLTNSEEKLYGIDPKNADSDNDGYSDGVEVKSGYDPLKPAPGDKLGTQNTASTANINSDTQSLTDVFSQNLENFISTNEEKTVSVDDVRNFADTQLASMSGSITNETLPEIDVSKIKVLKQEYSSFSEAKRKNKEKEDASNYLEKVIYLLINNAPVAITSKEDFTNFREDFLSHLSNLSDENSKTQYFSDLGNRLEIFIGQMQEIEVPETMVDLHVKFLRIAKGVLSLRDSSFSDDDPMGKMAALARISSYEELISDFFQNDFQNYFKSLE